jgi:hypothetical protein
MYSGNNREELRRLIRAKNTRLEGERTSLAAGLAASQSTLLRMPFLFTKQTPLPFDGVSAYGDEGEELRAGDLAR